LLCQALHIPKREEIMIASRRDIRWHIGTWPHRINAIDDDLLDLIGDESVSQTKAPSDDLGDIEERIMKMSQHHAKSHFELVQGVHSVTEFLVSSYSVPSQSRLPACRMAVARMVVAIWDLPNPQGRADALSTRTPEL
jgi:hypothetical protein